MMRKLERSDVRCVGDHKKAQGDIRICNDAKLHHDAKIMVSVAAQLGSIIRDAHRGHMASVWSIPWLLESLTGLC
jgi:hypothetical protein